MIAYLNSEYPSLSHTFIEREVAELRRLGARIQTVSVRPASAQGCLGEAHARAAQETHVLQAGGGPMLRCLIRAAVRRPLRAARAIIASQRLSPPGIGPRLRHAAYALQGMVLASTLSERAIRHVHVHMANNAAAIALLARVYDPGLRYSLSIHGSAEFFHVDSWTLRQKVEGAEFVRCISNFCKAQVMAWSDPRCWPRFSIVRCGIEPAKFPPRSGTRAGPVRFVTVGRLHPIKGYRLLLEACQRLKHQGVSFVLVMAGDGPEGTSLRSYVESSGLSGVVRLVGAVDQDRINELYDNADVIVVSSFMEGVPVVLMEAMAKELGVVSTRVGGVAELVEEGVSGFLVDAGSADGLASAMARYAADPTLSVRHGKAGRERVLRDYAIAGTASGMLDVFKREGVVHRHEGT